MYLDIVFGDETDGSGLVAGAVPVGVGWRPVQNL